VSGFRVHWSSEDQEWVGTSEDYPSLSWLADTPEEAITGIIRLSQRTALDEMVRISQELGLYE